MKKQTTFIVTTDKETADKMIEEGFKLVSENRGKYTFESKPINANFEQLNEKKVVYTNILSL